MKKHGFFHENIEYIYYWVSNPTFEKKKTGSRPGSPGSPGFRVTRIWPGCCHSRSFIKPGPVQPPGRPGPGSTCRTGPGLITVFRRSSWLVELNHQEQTFFNVLLCSHVCVRTWWLYILRKLRKGHGWSSYVFIYGHDKATKPSSKMIIQPFRWWSNDKSLGSRTLFFMWFQVRVLWFLIWWPLETYMVVNFRTRGISRGARKLTRTPRLN